MYYKKISGVLSDTAKIMVINESDWSIEMMGDGVAESYEVGLLVSGTKLVAARKSDGESIGYGNISPINHSPQMVLDKGSEGTYDITHVYHPCVIKDDTTYKMWYNGHGGDTWRILYATSINGTAWSNHQMVVNIGAEGTYDTQGAYALSMIKDGTTYKMWYSGHDGANYRIIYCTSANGTAWSNHQMVVNIGAEGTYDTTYTWQPCVIKDGATYKMWYSGDDGTNRRIIHCTSANGTTWSGHQMVVNIGDEGTYDTTHAYQSCVIKDDAAYKMWYSGDDGTNRRTIYCTSANGTTWSGHQMVVNIGDEGTYDTTHANAPSIIKDDFTYKMWYGGSDGTNWRIIYL